MAKRAFNDLTRRDALSHAVDDYRFGLASSGFPDRPAASSSAIRGSDARSAAPPYLPGSCGPLSFGQVQPPASLKGLDILLAETVFVPRETSRRPGVRNGKPTFRFEEQCCRRGCTSRWNPPSPHQRSLGSPGASAEQVHFAGPVASQRPKPRGPPSRRHR